MRLVKLPVIITAFIAVGCGQSQKLMLAEQAHQHTVDSLVTVQQGLQQHLYALQDTLSFYDDIDSGQYYRDRRLLADRIERLQFDLAVCRDGGQTLATLDADALFEPAGASLSDAGRQALDTVARRDSVLLASSQIRLEGHSDSTPMGPSLSERYPTNWELSSARAAAVARYLIDQDYVAADRIEVVGLADTRPVAGNDTADGRRKNRRVVIVAVRPAK